MSGEQRSDGQRGSNGHTAVLPANQAAAPEDLTAPSSPLPRPRLSGGPSFPGPPWEDASPNPNQVTNSFPGPVGDRESTLGDAGLRIAFELKSQGLLHVNYTCL